MRSCLLVLIALGTLGGGCTSPPERNRADDILNESQGLVAEYFGEHGELPSSSWITKEIQRTGADGTATMIDPTWVFSCELKEGFSPPMLVRFQAEGPNLKKTGLLFEISGSEYRNGIKVRRKGSEKR
jgi:hypothetical protein